jgi:hypothetical protein
MRLTSISTPGARSPRSTSISRSVPPATMRASAP